MNLDDFSKISISIKGDVNGAVVNTGTVNINKAMSPEVSKVLDEFKKLKDDFSEQFNKSIDSLKIPEHELREVKEGLKSKFKNFSALEESSQKLLISAEYIKRNISKVEDVDYSSVVAQYARAIENELVKKLHLKWKDGDNLCAIQNNLINGILNADRKLLDYIDITELSSRTIFSEKFLGYTFNPKKNLNYGKERSNEFNQKIRKRRNASSHSEEFDRTEAETAIKDMTDFLLEWTEVKFKTLENPVSSN